MVFSLLGPFSFTATRCELAALQRIHHIRIPHSDTLMMGTLRSSGALIRGFHYDLPILYFIRLVNLVNIRNPCTGFMRSTLCFEESWICKLRTILLLNILKKGAPNHE